MTAEVWVKSARRCLIGLDSVVHPEILRSKERLSSSSWDPDPWWAVGLLSASLFQPQV